MIRVMGLLMTCFLTLVLTLSGCATNTPRQNKALGATAGAGLGAVLGANTGPSPGPITIVGIGAIVGALIGSTYGNYMESSDKEKALQAIAAGKPAAWTNPETKVAFTIQPQPRCVTLKGNPSCRQFAATQTTRDGATRRIFRTACQASPGKWELAG